MRTEYKAIISSETISLIPFQDWNKLLEQNIEANNIENFSLLFDVQTAASIVSYNNNSYKKRLSSKKYTNWFSKRFQKPKYVKSKVEKQKKPTTKPSFSISRSKLALLNLDKKPKQGQ